MPPDEGPTYMYLNVSLLQDPGQFDPCLYVVWKLLSDLLQVVLCMCEYV